MTDSVGLYLSEIGTVALLDAAEERELAKAIEVGLEAGARIAAGETSPELRRQVAQGAAAKDRFIRANLRLVVSVARRYPMPPGMELLDLIQEGNIGLEHAVDVPPACGPRYGRLRATSTNWMMSTHPSTDSPPWHRSIARSARTSPAS